MKIHGWVLMASAALSAALNAFGVEGSAVGENARPGSNGPILPAAPERLTLARVVDLALRQNLLLKASEQQLLVDEAAVRQSGVALRPSITAALGETALDEDRAAASFGRAPQYRSSASLQINQLLYADEAHAAVQVQRSLQSAGSADQRELTIQTIAAAAQRFLALLEAESQHRILADDLKLTDSNYDRANVRLELGVANKAEVFRWQSRQASARRQVRSAEAALTRARIELNLVMNRPLSDPVEVVDPSLDDRSFLITDEDVWAHLSAGDGFGGFKDFCLEEAVSYSPELAALRHRRDAQERLLTRARREQIVPAIALSLNATSYLAKGGAGTEQLSFKIPGSTSTLGGHTDDNEWTAALTASLPLYRGGGRSADIDRATAELARVDIMYDASLERLHADVLASLATLEASLENIQFARDAASASRSNLNLVTDSYAKGIVTIIDLLDAQVASLSAELAAANAVYDFMRDYVILERSMGRFDFVLSDEERAASLARLKSRLL